MLLSDVCLSVAYIGPNSRSERPRKTKTGTEVAHVTKTWTPLSRSNALPVAQPTASQHRTETFGQSTLLQNNTIGQRFSVLPASRESV